MFVLVALVTVAALPASASGAMIEVEIRTDEFNSNGDCSLREAAQAANVDGVGQTEAGCIAGTGADIIDLDAGAPYTLSIPFDANVPDIDDGDLELTDPDGVTVLGEGRATTTVDRVGAVNPDRILEVTAGGLTLNSATVRDGIVSLAAGGGGILANGDVDVALVDAGVTNNIQFSSAGGGGGIALTDEASLTASGDSVINDNLSAGTGGGIFKDDDGDITLNPGVNVDDNDASGSGGGIHVTGGTSTTLTIDGASVSNNFLAEDATSFALGSAINFGGTTFDITDAEIISNDSIGDRAIAALDMFSNNASTIDSSTISQNTVTGQDDADGDVFGPAAIRFIANPGVTISDSTISQNTVTGADSQDIPNGAGVYPLGPFTLTGSTIASNSLSGTASFLIGAGLYIEDDVFGAAKILNSTFTANSAPSAGGAINLQGGGNLTIAQSTFSGNISPQGPALNIQNNPSTTLTLRGSIFDDGANGCQVIPSIIAFQANSFNIDAGTSCVDTVDDTDFENTDAQLGPLADNGGPTETMRLIGPANLFNAGGSCKQIDGVTNLLVDQRGAPRPSEGACEPGAYERFICNGVEVMQPGPIPACPGSNPGGGQSSENPECATLRAEAREAEEADQAGDRPRAEGEAEAEAPQGPQAARRARLRPLIQGSRMRPR